MTARDYTQLPTHQEALQTAKDDLYALLEQQQQGRTHNADKSKLPDQLFTLAAIVDFLLLMVKVQEEEIQVLHEKVRHLLAR